MKIELFYAPISCSMVPFINLTEAGADFDVHPINLGKDENRTLPFLSMNPKHNVPVIKINDEVLTENVAINLWIARNFPDANLLPNDSMKEIKAISLMAWFASSIHPALTPNFLPTRYCDMPGTETNVRQCAQRRLEENFGIADKLLADREWFFDHYTAPDAYFFWTFLRGTRFHFEFLDLTQFKHCVAHFERMKQRPSVRALLAFEEKTMTRFKSGT